MIIAILSILVLTCLVWVLNKILPIKVCAICAGVSLTWMWMLLGMWFGLLDVLEYEFVIAILMGASIGGIVTEIKKLFSRFRNKTNTKNKENQLLENKLKDCC